MTVIAGYLGAGKTTLINRLLAEDHGLKLLIMVNDFGAINIDENLLASRDEDTIALTNGCVCCTMGADLFLAIGDALDRRPRPDHLIVEASGVANPTQIANAAVAEPDMRYAGIITVVDGPAFEDLRNDPMIGAQVVAQIKAADLIYVSKQPQAAPPLDLGALTDAPVVSSSSLSDLLSLVGTEPHIPLGFSQSSPHPDYVTWAHDTGFSVSPDRLRSALATRPKGLFRLKGTIKDRSGKLWTLQVVGNQVDISPCDLQAQTTVVGIGLRALLNKGDVDTWWSQVMAASKSSASGKIT